VAIDYQIDRNCRLKRHLRRQGLVDHLKRQMILDLMSLARRRSLVRPVGRQGVEPPPTISEVARERLASRLRVESEALSSYSSDCASCPANEFAEREWGVGGCVGFVTLPIERDLERACVAHIVRTAADEGVTHQAWWEGIRAAATRELTLYRFLRAREDAGGPVFLQARRALPIRLAADVAGGALTTDTVLEFLLGFVDGDPPDAAAVGAFCAGLEDDLGAALGRNGLTERLERSRSVDDILRYGHACTRAAALGTAMWVGGPFAPPPSL